MSFRSRLQSLLKRASAAETLNGPLTLFLHEARPGQPVGTRQFWNDAGLEIVYDSAEGFPPLPPGGPHKIVLGGDPDWV